MKVSRPILTENSLDALNALREVISELLREMNALRDEQQELVIKLDQLLAESPLQRSNRIISN